MDEDAMLPHDVALVFLACNVGEARRAEELLTRSGVDYSLSFEPFVRPSVLANLIGTSEYIGVGFSVVSGQAAFCRDLLREHGLRTGIIEDSWPST